MPNTSAPVVPVPDVFTPCQIQANCTWTLLQLRFTPFSNITPFTLPSLAYNFSVSQKFQYSLKNEKISASCSIFSPLLEYYKVIRILLHSSNYIK